MNLRDVPAIAELAAADRWVCWLAIKQPSGRVDKQPISPVNGWRVDVASGRRRLFWSLDRCWAFHRAGRADGVGRVLGEPDLLAWDLDGCVDAETGEVAPKAQTIVEILNSYTEVTPSGTGLRVFCRGRLPAGVDGRKTKGIEVYAARRYVTVTGRHVAWTPRTIEARHDAVASLYCSHLGNGEVAPRLRARVELPDEPPDPMADDEYALLLDLPLEEEDQSRRDFMLACYCRGAGWSQEDAWRAIIRDRQERSPSGPRSKRWKKATRDDYVRGTIARAWAAGEYR